MKWIIDLHEITSEDRLKVGGKGFALARLAASGFRVPSALCITVDAYHQYVKATGLQERILLELHRKDFREMRWEEVWDAALRIRNLFLGHPLPEQLHASLYRVLQNRFEGKAVVVRSSSREEDSARASFAGLHESFVNVAGTDSILEHIRLVWASLWSDAALLYRQELGLDVHTSAMAVVVQQIVAGDRSGVVFSQNPNEPHLAVIECVYGLNQGLVDGTIEPDRWQFDRTTGRMVAHTPAQREKCIVPSADGVEVKTLPVSVAARPPLDDQELTKVFELSRQMEQLFGVPQDVEWTFQNGTLWVLQARPITTTQVEEGHDKRELYLSLRRSFDNLKLLRHRIENELIPAMIEEASILAAKDPAGLTDSELAEEIQRRSAIESKWVSVYWQDFIPFAHGVRLFGQFYNDMVRPQDPYEFVKLLGGTEMESIERNRLLEEMAAAVRKDHKLRRQLQEGNRVAADSGFSAMVEAFIGKFGDLSCPVTGVVACSQGPDALIRLVQEMASHPPSGGTVRSREVETLIASFLERFKGEKRQQAWELLDLARASYRLRDNDNIHLARIEAQKLAAVEEGRGRLARYGSKGAASSLRDEVARHAPTAGTTTDRSAGFHPGKPDATVQPRQLIGQPAGPGVSRGMARVILEPSDLGEFRHGEILVCDAVDPNMTFIVPLAAGIIERRGGMLIHGAIIAREYGLPCVTGVPDATVSIRTGEFLTVDGFLGIVTIGSSSIAPPP